MSLAACSSHDGPTDSAPAQEPASSTTSTVRPRPPTTTATTTTATTAPASVEFEHYDITGTTAGELRQSLDAHGPIDESTGDRSDAYTTWQIRWTWPGYGSDSCNLTDPQVTVQITVDMPRWAPPSGTSATLIAEWERYLRDLETHERGHVDNAVNSAPAVKTAIQTATCETADAAAQAALDRIRDWDVSYDTSTRHGATQGAVFP